MDEMENNLESGLNNEEQSFVTNIYPEQNTVNYTYDENNYYNGNNVKQPKPKKGTGKKIISLVLSGILFGGVAGGTFQAVHFLTNRNENTVIEMDSVSETLISTNRGLPRVEALNTGSGSIQGSVSAVAESSMPSIVSITKITVGEMYSFFGREMQIPGGEHSGSGIIVGENDTELLIVTNNHVVENSEELTVVFIDDSVATAQVKGTDPENDLAIIAIKLEDMEQETLGQIKIAELGVSEELVVGEQVVAIGNALGYGQSVTTGIVSALERTLEGFGTFIQTDAAINFGNSGGALINMAGQVIGINSAKLASTGIEGMGYAIPISTAEPIIENLMNQTTRERVAEKDRGIIGITGADVTSDISSLYGMPIGIYVTQIVEDSSAAEQGMKKGDIIVQFEGMTIASIDTLRKRLQYYKVGETVSLTYAREEEGEYVEITIEVELMVNTSSIGSQPEEETESQTWSNPFSR